MSQIITVPVTDGIANPAPLGLCAFGMTTVLLNVHNAGFFELNSMILAMGIFYGGTAQIIAGIIESRKNNVFGLTAFTSYGLFWLTFVAIGVLPKLGWVAAPDTCSMIAFLSVWLVLTIFLFFATLRMNRALQLVFGTLILLFILLIAGDATGNEGVKHFAGYEGIVCGALAIYTGLAILLNDVYGRTVLPIGA